MCMSAMSTAEEEGVCGETWDISLHLARDDRLANNVWECGRVVLTIPNPWLEIRHQPPTRTENCSVSWFSLTDNRPT